MKIVVSVVLALLLVGCSNEDKKEVKKEIAEVVEASVEKSVEIAQKIVKETEEVVETSVEKVEEVVAQVISTKSGEDLYTSCKGCHGAKGEKSALGKSKIIQAWDATKTANALSGYKDGTYGGAMKGLMKGQVSKLSDADIKILSEYISKL